MLKLRRSNERGHLNHGWLDAHHTFSFGDFYDPAHMHFRSLRVINEDRVEPGKGFGTHPHRDMEIITYILSGALEHRDSLGSGSVIRPGDVQYMSAGSGIEHSEFNPSDTEPVHLLQIWILPVARGLEPHYEEKSFSTADRTDQLRLIVSHDRREGSIQIRQNADIYASLLGADKSLEVPLKPERYGWLQLARGSLIVNEETLRAGDALSVHEEALLNIRALESAEFLLFDLA
jgi:redox-sensitive bicupin YhaK (pirin superfamily)